MLRSSLRSPSTGARSLLSRKPTCGRSSSVLVRCSNQEESKASVPPSNPVATAPSTPVAPPEPAEPPSKGLQKGQGTAIVTGVISIIFGVAYLALVYVMDTRGGQMLPPPPEAFIP
jgi:hypothetical protein